MAKEAKRKNEKKHKLSINYEEDFRKYSCAKIIFSLWNFFVVDLFPSWL